MQRIVVAALLLTCACATQTSGLARAQEAAQEMNLNTRFGRMELAVENVAPETREEFVSHRRAWGNKLRIADTEMAGLRKVADENVEVLVRVAWFRMADQDLKVTTLKQKWHDFKGDWKLVSETRLEGDIGLIGEPVAEAPPQPREHAQFPTVRLGSAN